MIYLIKSGNYLKIGYAHTIQDRLKQYYPTNPDFELLDTMDGTQEKERFLHTLCAKYAHRNEWFLYNQEILDIFAREKEGTSPISEEELKNIQPLPESTSVEEKYETLLKRYSALEKNCNRWERSYQESSRNYDRKEAEYQEALNKIDRCTECAEKAIALTETYKKWYEESQENFRYFRNIVKKDHPELFD